MKCCVVGGAGFIGGHVVTALAEAGHKVTVVDLSGTRPAKVADFAPCDIVRDPPDGVAKAIYDSDVVFHLAGVANVNDARDDPVRCVDLNVGGTARVLQACVLAGVKRFVLASTVWVYAATRRDGRPVDEREPFFVDGSNHLYTSTKLAAEMLTHDYASMYGLPYTILRYGIPYGPHMRKGMVVERFVSAALAGETLKVLGRGDATRKYIHVTDLATAHVAALAANAANQTYTVDGAEQVSVLQIADMVRELFAANRRDVWVEYLPPRPGDYLGHQTSTAKIEAELGWAPQVSFQAGLDDYVRWRCARL